VKTIATYTATIYVGFRERDTGVLHDISEVRGICQEYCDNVGLCVTVTPTEYIYTNGNEPGAFIGFINYPRFPDTSEHIKSHVLRLANIIMIACKQYRVTIVFPDETVMLENEEL